MAAPANTHLEVATVGIREDLENTIYRVAAEETPFMNNIGKMKIKGTLHELQTEDLATPDPDNSHLEGGDVTIEAAHVTKRVGVYAQIFQKSGGVSRTNNKNNRAGVSSTLDEQKEIKGIELRRDMEARIIGNKASRAESGATTRETAGALAWVETNDSLGATGASGGWSAGGVVDAATNGTQRTFTEAQIKGLIATGFSEGARYSQAYMSMAHKQQFGAFTGLADNRVTQSAAKQKVIVGAADVYVTDAGNLTLIPHAYGLTRDCLLIDPSGWAVGTYDGMHSYNLAKTGDSEKFMIVCEKALVCKNEKKGAVVRDLT